MTCDVSSTKRACRALALSLFILTLIGVGPVDAQNRSSDQARSDALTRPRVALVLVPQPAEESGRASLAGADADILARRLRDIGFEIRTVGPASRPELMRMLRDAAGSVPVGADIAVLALGQALGGPDDVFVVPGGAPADLAGRAHLLDTEAIRLGDLLRRLADRRPRELVAIVDECRPAMGAHCPLDAAVGTSGASLIAAERTDPRGSGSPVAAQASLREPLLHATAQEDQSFLQFFEGLRAGLVRTDLAALASSRLSSSFQFLPAGFFRGLRTECNRVDPALDPTAVRSLALDPLVRACQGGLDAYPFANFFRSQLGAAREQLAFQRAVAGCDRLAASAYRSAYPAGRFRSVVDDQIAECARREERDSDQRRRNEEDQRRRDEASRQDDARRRDQEEEASYRRAVASCADRREVPTYLARYPTGRYRAAIDDFVRGCEASDRQREQERRDRERQGQRALLSSRTGWTATYLPSLLHIEPGDHDNVNAYGLVTTYLRPNAALDGKVDFFLQTGENKECQGPEAWAQRVLTRNRPTITNREMVTVAGQRALFQEGPAFRGDSGTSFLDVVMIPRQDPNMFVHLGVQFPAADRSKWRDEFIRVLASFQLSPTGSFPGRCR